MKNTWLIIKDILHKENNKSKFPLEFVHTNATISDKQQIALLHTFSQ